MPKISYVVPVYNAEKTLQRCVESLVYGDETDCEILLSEDCSSDGSWELCLQLADKFSQVRCIRNLKNSGVSRTRNHALEEATGEYILFVDSDDWVTHEYATTLLAVVQEAPDSLVVAGFRFFDRVAGYQQDYIWQENGDEHYVLEKNEFFSLIDKTLIQFLWNKAFRRDIIEQAQIRFDESQSMGEDFEFVLDYMNAISCEKCVVINKPLYSYIRANNTSLMSKFGLVENDDEYKRFEKLFKISGEVTREKYEIAVENLRNNYIYHALRAKGISSKEKKIFIKKLIDEKNFKREYMAHRITLHKEQLVKGLAKAKATALRVRGRFQRELNNAKIRKFGKALRTQEFTILSQNCIAGVFYHDMGLPFQTPTINLYLTAPDFLKFVANIDRYIAMDIQMKWGLDYPLGTLDDITVHFMHYETCEEAKNAWNRRKERINREKIVVFCTDMEEFDDEVYEQWKQIAYPKVLFTANEKYKDCDGSVYFSKYRKNGRVPDLIPKREFYKDGIVLKAVNIIVG